MKRKRLNSLAKIFAATLTITGIASLDIIAAQGGSNRIFYPGAKKGWLSQANSSETNHNIYDRERRDYPTWDDIKAQCDDKDFKDSIVTHGEYLGKKLHWKAKWYVESKDEPGAMLDSGGTSGWKLLNTADPAIKPEWNGCIETQTNITKVGIPTWQDGAKGNYTLISDDIGAYEDPEGYEEIYVAAKKINDQYRDQFGGHSPLRFAFGCQVDITDENEWEWMRKVIKDGHEIISHSWNHTSAAHQWQEFYQNDTTGNAMTEINGFTQAAGDTIPISGVCTGADDDYVKHLSYVSSLRHVGKDLPKWASGAIVVNSEYANISGEETDYFGYKIKDTPNARYIKCNKKVWIDKAKVGALVLDCSARDDGLASKYDGWDDSERDSNVVTSREIITENTYSKLKDNELLNNQYFDQNKVCEFYIYPYDAFSKKTHDYLDSHGYVAARGGSKTASPTPMDFFHPYRTDFDAHYGDKYGVYPKNPHQYLSLSSMLDSIVVSKGTHTREIHTVTDRDDLGWGYVPINAFDIHCQEIVDKMVTGDLTMMTATDVVKYRITADNMTAAIAKSGKIWTVTPTVTLDQKYKDKYKGFLMSYMVTLPDSEIKAGKKLLARYVETQSNGIQAVRRQPRKIETQGRVNTWAVYGDPYKGEVEFGFEGDIDVVSLDNSKLSSNKNINFNGYRNGKLSFTTMAGNYSAKVMTLNGKMINEFKGVSNGGSLSLSINQSKLPVGFYVAQMKINGQVFNSRFLVRK